MADNSIIDDLYKAYQKLESPFCTIYFYQVFKDYEEKRQLEIFLKSLDDYLLENSGKLAQQFTSKSNDTDGLLDSYIYILDILQSKINHICMSIYMNKMVYGKMDPEKNKLLLFHAKKEAEFYLQNLPKHLLDVLAEDNYKFKNILLLQPNIIEEFYKFNPTQYLKELEFISDEDFQKIKDFLVNSKNVKTLSNVGLETLETMPFEQQVHLLYNKLKADKKLLTSDAFEKIRYKKFKSINTLNLNLNNILGYTEFKSVIGSDKKLELEIDKLIFVRNLVELYNTGLFFSKTDQMPPIFPYVYEHYMEKISKDDLFQFETKDILTLDFIDKEIDLRETKAKFNSIYANFKEEEFVNMQGNFIYQPTVPTFWSKDVLTKHDIIDNMLYIGFLIVDQSGESSLIHIAKDLCDDKGKYEIQFNILPHHRLDCRVQLLRIDNYKNDGFHKNIGGTKVKTKSHVHIYNQLDLIRGKKNGGYDIAYNMDDTHSTFNDALNLFMEMIELDDIICKQIKTELENIQTEKLEKE